MQNALAALGHGKQPALALSFAELRAVVGFDNYVAEEELCRSRAATSRQARHGAAAAPERRMIVMWTRCSAGSATGRSGPE